MSADDSLPDDIETLKQLIRARDAELSRARAEATSAEALIAHLRLAIEKLKRDIFGPRSERTARLLNQLELELEELKPTPARTSTLPRRLHRRPAIPFRFAPSRARSLRASRSRHICRANG